MLVPVAGEPIPVTAGHAAAVTGSAWLHVLRSPWWTSRIVLRCAYRDLAGTEGQSSRVWIFAAIGIILILLSLLITAGLLAPSN